MFKPPMWSLTFQHILISTFVFYLFFFTFSTYAHQDAVPAEHPSDHPEEHPVEHPEEYPVYHPEEHPEEYPAEHLPEHPDEHPAEHPDEYHQDECLEKQEFLDAHNKIREHMGEPPLQWDEQLVEYAKNWARALSGDCNMIHSNGPYGENLFWGGDDHWTPTEVVQSWAGESQYFDDKGNTCTEGQMCGHYTQVIWRKTCRIGCARQKCDHEGLLVVCNYDPPGNYDHENPLTETN